MYNPLRHISSLFYINRPIQLTFFLTRRCNAKCPYCFYLKNNNCIDISARDQCRDELNLQEIKRISKSLGSLLWLSFSGGEVFLRRDLIEISRVFYDNNRPVYMLFPTNGLNSGYILRCMKKIVQYCRHSEIVVKFSIDDLFERNDILRNTPGHFAKTLRSYELLAELSQTYKNLKLGVNTVFCSKNQDHMQAIIDYVANMTCISTHTISLLRGDLRYPEYKEVDLNKYRFYTQLLARKHKQHQTSLNINAAGGRFKLAQDMLQRKLIHQTQLQQRRLVPCYAGRANLVLTEMGELYPCESFENSFGNVREYGYNINTMLASPQVRTELRAIKQQHCFCSHECYFITNIMLNPMLYPQIIKEYIKLRAA